ncbi:fumarylacetoacetate hydrolase family protein [Nitratifractor sp.]|uniref:fumarylacetoacetate hydrolase family protein n=1 Tax=Nitratifractor sp. TaxID=2268144 RepID=UPI0025ED49C8|nr:fumarylacetoacetate hydrolase family protein [Nitratifractor sp.]
MKTVQFDRREIIPSKVVCVGRNYVEHIRELGNETPENMVLFNKPNSAITHELKYIQEDCRFEGEICFLIQKREIAGIGFGFDLTKAETQNRLKAKGLPWERAKAFDGSAVLSPFVPLNGDLTTVEMRLYRNDTLQQHGDYGLMIYKPHEILEEIQSFMSLEDGDIVMSGTPKGVDTYQRGERFSAEIYLDGALILQESFVAR